MTGVTPEAADALGFARNRLGFEPDEKQARLLSVDGRRVILNCSRQWGKSTVTAVRAVWEAYSNPGSLTLVVSKSRRQTGEFMKKAARLVARLGITPRRDPGSEISLALPNGSRIVGVPAREDNVRGYSAVSLLILDEAARVPDEMYEAVLPMLATSNGRLWLLSTPWQKQGFFYEEWEHGGAEWERVSAPATECARISKEFLEEQQRRRSEVVFRREYLCEFTKGDDMLFDRDMLEKVFTDDTEGWTW